MVIAFYPGAGGNRYYRWLNQLEWKQSNKSYDYSVTDQYFENRYLTDPISTTAGYALTHAMNYQQIRSAFPEREITYINGSLQKCLKREWVLAGHSRYKQKMSKKTINRLKHYADYKDERWPMANTIEQLESLPLQILREVELDFISLNKESDSDTSDLQQVVKNLSDKAESAYEIINWHFQYYCDFPPNFFGCNSNKVINIETDDTEFANVMRKELDMYHSEIFDEVWELVHGKC